MTDIAAYGIIIIQLVNNLTLEDTSMKKIISIILCAVLVMAVFTACGSNAGNVKTGLAVITEASKSKDAGEADGLAQVNSTAVAVLVDGKGVIKNIVIDVVQTKVNFSATGEITTDKSAVFVSKQELKDAYNMKGASGIGKEWYEQAAALEKYVTGKTLDEVKKISLSEGYPTDEDLTSSVTMSIADIIVAIEKAVNNAEDLGAKANDKLGLGIISSIAKSSNAGDKDGLAQAYTHYGVISLDKNNKITSSIIDASQSNVNFSTEGKITSDFAAGFKTKLELGNDYNMKGASPIGKEWFEQSEAFSKYIKGKTVADVKGITLDDGVATIEDLKSSVTIGIADYITVIDKAGATAE